MDFLKAVQIPSCEIQLAGEVITVARCPLLPHYHLRAVAERLAASDPTMRLEATFEYISIATGVDELSGVGVDELTPALEALHELNDSIDTLPWQETVDMEQIGVKVTSSADYDNRELAIIVDAIAHAYGWSVESIFNLQPDVAACYVQEIMLRDWQDRDFAYRLSEVAYDKDGKLIDFPAPGWYTKVVGPTVEEATGPIPVKFMPKGVVIGVDGERVNVPEEED